MPLIGNTRELSLADLILVKSHDPGTYRLRLSGPAGDGLIFIREGRVVHAAYGELPAADAAYLLVTEEGVEFEVQADATTLHNPTLDLGAEELLMEAMRRFDEGTLRRPKPVSFHVGGTVSARREPPRPRSYEARKSPETEALRRAMGRVLFAEPETKTTWLKAHLGRIALGAVVVSLSLYGYQAGWFTPGGYRDPVSLSDLDGPRDLEPLLLSGGPGIAPADVDPLPTIVYRIVVDTRGRVHPDRPNQSSEGLEEFEEAAKEVLKGFRFAPAVREGAAVPVRMNWPVDFVVRREPGPDPVPVDRRYFNETWDEPPVLVQGEPPDSPLPESRRRPTIVCRILVDEEGNVSEASIPAPSPELAAYEKVVLEVVRSYKFTPGRRENTVVPTWVDLPVEFSGK